LRRAAARRVVVGPFAIVSLAAGADLDLLRPLAGSAIGTDLKPGVAGRAKSTEASIIWIALVRH
jgi:hypothetical protein